MINFKKIFYILSPKERIRALYLLLLILVMALIDMLGIASIMPFIALLTKPEIIETNKIINFIYQKSKIFGVENDQDFLIFTGILIFFILIISITFKAVTVYFQSRYIRFCEYTLSKRLVERYLYQPYSWFLNRNSSYIGKTVLSETSNAIGKGLGPSISLVSNVIVVLFLFVMLFYVDPILTTVVATTISSFYLIVYIFIRKLLNKIAKKNFKYNELKFKSLSEAFGASKEIKIGGLEQVFINRFTNPSRKMAYNLAFIDIIGQLPKFMLEVISFGGLILVILFYMILTKNITEVLPIVALYAFAGYRIMPAIQKIFVNLTTLRISRPAISSLYTDLKILNLKINNNYEGKLIFNQNIKLRNIDFTYPKSSKVILKNINLTIPAYKTIGIVGKTGSGKSTTIDIILGLLEAQKGTLEVDGKIINSKNVRSWQNLIGYVPQQIYLADTTVSENIAFGVNIDEINPDNVKHAAKVANLHEFVMNELPYQYQTTIGERGIRLSGGQRQRIGIARAIYHQPKLLIFDEATSALDNITEKFVMEAIHETDYKITKILVAHRLSTVKKCDKIFLFDKGEIKHEGDYQELLDNSEEFRKSANIS